MVINFSNIGTSGGQGGGVTTGQVQTMINNNNSAYTRTDGFATINSSAITAGGNIEIQASDPNAEKVVELTQAQYNALSAYAENTTYVISDASAVDLDDYASQDAMETFSGNVVSALTAKADKQTVTAYTGASYYSSVQRFPTWNADGVITGNDGQNWGAGWSYVNGSSKNLMAKDGSTFTIYAPTAAGTQNQMLISNGSGAPSWVDFYSTFTGGVKFWKGTEEEYEAITTKDSSTLYIIVEE